MIRSKTNIINHFDNLIQRLDIDIEKSLEKCNENQVIGDLECYKSFKKNEKKTKRKKYPHCDFECDFESFNLNESSLNKSHEIRNGWLKDAIKIEQEMLLKRLNNSQELEFNNIYKTVDLWSESTKVVDYLNQIRMRTIEELRKAQEVTLESYKSQKGDSKSQFLPDKFYFQICFNHSEPEEWIFKVFTFVTDFYMSPNDITLLDTLINGEEDDKLLFCKLLTDDSNIIFNEQMVLIGLLQKYFFDNLKSEKFPSHVIEVRKKDLLNIKQISLFYSVDELNLTDSSSIDLSNIERLNIYSILGEKINLDGLSSLEYLHLRFGSLDLLSLRNLPSLRNLELESFIRNTFDSTIKSQVLDYLPSIEYLTLSGDLSYFNLDSLVNLKCLTLSEYFNDDFNFYLLKTTLCYQLEELCIYITNLDDECLSKLLNGCHFPVLTNLSISSSDYIKKIEKKLFDKFPMLQTLSLCDKILEKIDSDVFSNVRHLISLDLSNNSIRYLNEMHFSGLDKLKYLNLSANQLESIEGNVFSSLKELTVLDLSDNYIHRLNANSFASLTNLLSLNIKDNFLKTFDLKILDYIGKIEQIDLSGNMIDNEKEILDKFKDKFTF